MYVCMVTNNSYNKLLNDILYTRVSEIDDGMIDDLIVARGLILLIIEFSVMAYIPC